MHKVYDILARYVFVFLVVLVSLSLPVFYFIFKPLTIWPVVSFLKMFYDVSIINHAKIVVENAGIEFIDACIASSAYLLLFILNFITREISLKKRILVFVFDSALLLIMNIFRIIALIIMSVNNSFLFDAVHKIFWYGVSTIYVFLIWILTIYVFKIKEIPFISDALFLLKLGKKS